MKEKEKENQLLKMMHSPKSITTQSNKNRRTAVVESNDLKSNILLKKKPYSIAKRRTKKQYHIIKNKKEAIK